MRMKNLFYTLLFAALIVLFNACNKDNSDDVWRKANADAYEAVTKGEEYTELTTGTGPSGVYYKSLETGTGTEHPLQTSTVKVLYSGTYYDGSVFDAGTTGNNIPVEFSLAGTNTIRGFSFALQNMFVGDHWQICIPYYLGYGAAGYTVSDYYSYSYQTIIKGYTTLFFDIKLVSITQYPN